MNRKKMRRYQEGESKDQNMRKGGGLIQDETNTEYKQLVTNTRHIKQGYLTEGGNES